MPRRGQKPNKNRSNAVRERRDNKQRYNKYLNGLRPFIHCKSKRDPIMEFFMMHHFPDQVRHQICSFLLQEKRCICFCGSTKGMTFGTMFFCSDFMNTRKDPLKHGFFGFYTRLKLEEQHIVFPPANNYESSENDSSDED